MDNYFTIKNYQKQIKNYGFDNNYIKYYNKKIDYVKPYIINIEYIKPWVINLILCLSKTKIYHYHRSEERASFKTCIIMNILKNLKIKDMLDYEIYMIHKSLYVRYLNMHPKIIREIKNFYKNFNNIEKIFDLLDYYSKFQKNIYFDIIYKEYLNNTLLIFNKELYILYFSKCYYCWYHYYNKFKYLLYDINFMYEVIKKDLSFFLEKDKKDLSFSYYYYSYFNHIRYNKEIIDLVKDKIKINNKNFPLEYNDNKEFIYNNTKLGFIKSIKYASKKIKNDKEFILELINLNYKVVKYIKNNKLYKDYAMEINKKAIGYFF